jgi:sulfur carrier protein ThiS
VLRGLWCIPKSGALCSARSIPTLESWTQQYRPTTLRNDPVEEPAGEATPHLEEMMARVELQVYPPFSYRMSSKKVGALILQQEIDQGETLGDPLARLESSDPEAWRGIFDAQTGRMQPAVLTILNSTLLSRSDAPQTALSDGDQIAIRMAYSGG